MALIYKITNTVNEKIYIGKTNFSLEKRWKEHIHDLERVRCEKRPLYSAMLYHGIDKFNIELIEECNSEESSLREQYWIGYYKSFTEGYNATIGGDGKTYKFTEDDEIQIIVDKYNSGMNCKQIAKDLDCDHTTISRVLKDKGINIGREKIKDKYLRSFGIIAIRGQERIDFETKEEAIDYFLSINPVKRDSVSSSINRVLGGSRQTYLGYHLIKKEKES